MPLFALDHPRARYSIFCDQMVGYPFCPDTKRTKNQDLALWTLLRPADNFNNKNIIAILDGKEI